MRNRKYAISGAILAISMLLAISVLSPTVAAEWIVDGGHLETTVDEYGTVYADATAGGPVAGTGSPATITTQITVDDDYDGPSRHYWYLRAYIIGGDSDEDYNGIFKAKWNL